MDILQAIGDTSMVRLRRVVPTGCGDVFVKLEWELVVHGLGIDYDAVHVENYGADA